MNNKERNIIAVTGTPGTGKTIFSKKLARELNFKLVDINNYVEKEGIYELDKNGTKAVDPKDLRESFKKKESESTEDLVLDSLLSHLLSPDQLTEIIVLRTKPSILKYRLSKRNYSEEKINENLEAEAIGVILQEAIRIHGTEKVYELDTTELTPSESVSLFIKAFSGEKSLNPGSVDWLKDFYFKK